MNGNLDLDFDFNFDLDASEEKHPDAESESENEPSIRSAHRMSHRQLSRRLTSEKVLEDAVGWHFKEGDCYHCFSWGNVDFLTYVKLVLRQQPIKYLAISTWCMAGEDVLEIHKWWQRGFVGRADFFVGEIFKGSYPEAWKATEAFCREEGGRIVVFRNHAKVAIIVGEQFDCLIESSANVNTNPRSENTVVTVDHSLVTDYLDIFNGIHSFDRSFDDIEPWRGD